MPSAVRSLAAPIVEQKTRAGLPDVPVEVLVHAIGIMGSFCLPETGPAPTEVRRPKDVLRIPLDMYLREAGGHHKRKDET